MVPAVSAYIPANEFIQPDSVHKSTLVLTSVTVLGGWIRRPGEADRPIPSTTTDAVTKRHLPEFTVLDIGLIGHDPWFNLMCAIAEPGRIKPHLRAQQRKLAEEISDFSVTEYGADDHDGGRQLDEIFRYGSGGLTDASLFLAARATGWVDGNVVRLVVDNSSSAGEAHEVMSGRRGTSGRAAEPTRQ